MFFRRAILPHEILGTPVTKYSLTYGANWQKQQQQQALGEQKAQVTEDFMERMW
jgi:hypothetical protein